jgi:cation:H+ antiporter
MASKRSQGVAIGTLIGSNITDPLLSIGLAGVIHPLAISSQGFDFIVYILMPVTVVGCGIALLMMRTSYEFKKWEGYTMILIYVLFLIVLESYNRKWITF